MFCVEICSPLRNYNSDVGTRDNCRDNVTIFESQKHTLETPFGHRGFDFF